VPVKVFREGEPITFIHDGYDQSPVLLGVTRQKVESGFGTREEALTVALFHAGWHAREFEQLDPMSESGVARRRELWKEPRDFIEESPGLWSMMIDKVRYTFREVGTEVAP
jgi:hypothetical protein